MESSQLLIRMKHFVRSTECSSTSTVSKNKPNQSAERPFVSGSGVRQFYEKTVGRDAFEAGSKPKVVDHIAVEKSKLIPKNLKRPFNVNLFMKAVETGNLKEVKRILEENEEAVNCQDQFGWTPLMSACCSGQVDVVQLLLEWKPNLKVRDKKGNTCRCLAASNGHQNILVILDEYVQNMHKPLLEPVHHEHSSVPVFYCKVCKQNVENTTKRKHLASTVHNFHAVSKRKMPTLYGIPENNRGFQILLRSGWNKEEGLGPSGEGHKFPPKTILKKDRTGLGARKYKPRVTHALEDTKEEVKPVTTFKRNFKSEKRKEQRLERNLRRILS